MRNRSRRPSKPLDEAGLWQYALRLLGRRAYSIAEIKRKLERRAAAGAGVETVTGKLEAYGYLNDQVFAENFAAARLENQGFGRERVLRDLRARSVPAPVAARAVEKVFSPTDEQELIENYLRRKYRAVSLTRYLGEASHLASAYRRLRYAGFSATNSIRVLRRYSEHAEDLETLEGDSE